MSTPELGGPVWTSWRKSSYSGNDGNGGCVEIAWRKSSRSGNNGTGDCVEIAHTAEAVGVRDSKNVTGPTLAFTQRHWREFLNRY